MANPLDLAAGIAADALPDEGMLAGKVGDEDVLLVRGASGLFAVDALCTHLGAPLADGMLTGDVLRCPWHHACFHARSGEALAAPAFAPLGRWHVEEHDGRILVRRRASPPPAPSRSDDKGPVVIVGAGAAGYATADALVRLGYGGPIAVVGQEPDRPCDRTLLSKDYLEDRTPEDGLAIEGDDLATRGVDLRLGVAALAIDRAQGRVDLADGTSLPYAKLVLATGAEPRRLTIPGAEEPHVAVLRSVEDARRLRASAAAARRVAVIGSSFIGLEVAASLRTTGCAVTVVSPEERPLLKLFGPDLSDAVMAVHRAKGVDFHLGRGVIRIEPDHLILDDRTIVAADLVLVGIGVSPRLALAERAGLAIEGGVLVDDRMRTSDSSIYAVGDIARWLDPHSGRPIRVEHWNVATRQGQAAALDIVGQGRPFTAVPFFWTKHFDFSIRYLGHAEDWDEAVLEGDPSARDAAVRFLKDGRELALATVERDGLSLRREAEMERRVGGPALWLPTPETTP